MKKVMFFATMCVASVMFVSCNEKAILESGLPASSRTFLQTHFPNEAVTHVTMENEGFGKEYTAYLTNGFSVVFGKKGDWDKIRFEPMPQSVLDLLPAGIVEYVATAFPNNSEIVKVSKERKGYEIGLNGKTKLKFNTTGKFIGYDD